MKEILIKAMNEKAGAYKDRGYNCIDAALSTVAYTAELALEAGNLPQADYAEVMKEYARLYGETLKEEEERPYRAAGG